jgi:predicted nucleic-acid-binding Zn-ribbon protein
MPDEGRLTQEQKQAIRDWFSDSERAGLGCPWCGKKKFTLGDYLAAAPLLVPPANLQLGRQYPFVVLFCDNCGYANLFASVRIEGLHPKGKAEEAKVSDAKR